MHSLPAPHQRQVIGGHLVARYQAQASKVGLLRYLFTLPNAPACMVRAQALVKLYIACGGLHTVFKIRSVGHQHTARSKVARTALHQCSAGLPRRYVQHIGAKNQIELRRPLTVFLCCVFKPRLH